jgi:molybdopterin-containing oxidoreductase family iron-sulfur binding subunit
LTVTKGKGSYDLCVTKVHNIEHRGKFAQQDLEKKEFDTQGVYSLAGHEAMERSIIRYATVSEALANPKYASEGASGTFINKVGYNPQGEAPEHGWQGVAEQVGYVDRSELLYRLQRLRCQLLRGEQHRGRWP